MFTNYHPEGKAGSAFSGAVIIYAGNVTANGGKGGYYGNRGVRGSGATKMTPGEYGSFGEYGTNGTTGNAFASDVTFEAATYTMTDGTVDITTATGYKEVNLTSADSDTEPTAITITWNASDITEKAQGAKARKLFRNDKMFIEKNGEIYTVAGARVE